MEKLSIEKSTGKEGWLLNFNGHIFTFVGFNGQYPSGYWAGFPNIEWQTTVLQDPLPHAACPWPEAVNETCYSSFSGGAGNRLCKL